MSEVEPVVREALMEYLEEILAEGVQISDDHYFTPPNEPHDLSRDLGFDSLDRVEVVMALEERLDLKLKPYEDQIYALNTIGQLVAFVTKLYAEQKATASARE